MALGSLPLSPNHDDPTHGSRFVAAETIPTTSQRFCESESKRVAAVERTTKAIVEGARARNSRLSSPLDLDLGPSEPYAGSSHAHAQDLSFRIPTLHTRNSDTSSTAPIPLIQAPIPLIPSPIPWRRTADSLTSAIRVTCYLQCCDTRGLDATLDARHDFAPVELSWASDGNSHKEPRAPSLRCGLFSVFSRGGWVRDLTVDGVEPNPGPPKKNKVGTEFSDVYNHCRILTLVIRQQGPMPEGKSTGKREKPEGGAGGAGAGPSSKRTATDTAREKELRKSISFWEAKVRELTGKDAVGAMDAKIEQHDAEAKLSRLQGDQEAVHQAEMAKAKAEMAKGEAKMAKAKAEMAKAKAEMAKAKEGSEAHTMAKREYERAEKEYEVAAKVHTSLVEQVAGGGSGGGMVVFQGCRGDSEREFQRYMKIGDVLRKGKVPLQETVDRIYSSTVTPKPFALLDGPSGIGKSQQFFALSNYRVIYIVLSPLGGAQVIHQEVYKAFAALSSVFQACAQDDCRSIQSDDGVVSTSHLQKRQLSSMRTPGLILAVLKHFFSIKPDDCLKVQATERFKLPFEAASPSDVKGWLLDNPDHRFVFALDEVPSSDTLGKPFNTFCRSFFRECGLTVVLAGTDASMKNCFVDPSRSADQLFWAELQLSTPKPTIPLLQISAPKFKATHKFAALVARNRPLVAQYAASAISSGTRDLDDVVDAVARSLFMAKSKLRGLDGLRGQLCMFQPAYQLWGTDDSKEENGGPLASHLVVHHMADLKFDAEAGKGIEFWIRDTHLCCGDSVDPWQPRCYFRNPMDEPLLFLCLQGTKSFPALTIPKDPKHSRFTTRQALRRVQLEVTTIGVDQQNPNAVKLDGDHMESLGTTAWCIASHEHGTSGSPVDGFFEHLCTELSLVDGWRKLSLSPALSTFLLPEASTLRMPYLFPPTPNAISEERFGVVAKHGLFGQLHRPADSKEFDIQMVFPSSSAPKTLKCSGEAKNYSKDLDASVLGPCLRKIPKESIVHFIFCRTVSRVCFQRGFPEGLPNMLILVAAANPKDPTKCRLEFLNKHCPRKSESWTTWQTVVILPVDELPNGVAGSQGAGGL